MESGSLRPDDENLAGHREDLVLLLSKWSARYRSGQGPGDSHLLDDEPGRDLSEVELPGTRTVEESLPFTMGERER